MSLNCAERTEDGEPCGTCADCERIWSGTTSLDVVEIDAASNRGVDDARELRERAMYAASAEGRYKVYIVDEAHMLTREAWNALLKILEEPPPRVVFVFATTEPQKIEQTAAPTLSRCQRFDFRRVGVAEIVDRLEAILREEGREAPQEPLRIIARKADGGMRDALSLLDQVLALSEGQVTPEAVRRVLGVVEEERYLELFDLLSARDRSGIFRLIEALLDQGYDLVEFYYGLLEGLRTLLRLRVGGDGADLPEDRRASWEERARSFEPGDLVRMLGMAAELETGGSLRRNQQPRVLLELLLLRFSYLDRTLDLQELLGALGGEPSPAAPPPPSPPASSSNPGPSAVESGPTPPASSAEAPDRAHGERVPEKAVTDERDGRSAERSGGGGTAGGALLKHWKAGLAEEGAGERISIEKARSGRLQDLLDKEPALRPAVEKLDLELLD